MAKLHRKVDINRQNTEMHTLRAISLAVEATRRLYEYSKSYLESYRAPEATMLKKRWKE